MISTSICFNENDKNTHTVSFISASGGVGKTTFSLGFAAYLRWQKGYQYRILLVDLDPTAGLSLNILTDEEYSKYEDEKKTFSDLYFDGKKKNIDIEDYVISVAAKAVPLQLLIPGEKLQDVVDDAWKTGIGPLIIRRILSKAGLYSKYDLIIFDSAPFFDYRYTIINLYVSSRYVTILRPSIVDFRRTLHMLTWLLYTHATVVAGSGSEFFIRFLAILNMVGGRRKGKIHDAFLRYIGLQTTTKHFGEMINQVENYMNKLKSMINVSDVYLSDNAFIETRGFLEKPKKKHDTKREEYENVMRKISSWLNIT